LTITQNANLTYNITVVAAAYQSTPNTPIAVPNNSSPSSAPAPNSLWLVTLAAAGIGAVAFAPAASATVVVTSLNQMIGVNKTCPFTVEAHNVMTVSNYFNKAGTSAAVDVESGTFWGARTGTIALLPVSSGQLIPGGGISSF
jgi:hypothetical protein